MSNKNPLIEINRRAMDYIWSKVPKEIKDGEEYITYVQTDLPYLYYSGLVDTARFTLEQWERAFADCLGEDGRYWVNHRKMLFLGMFRYHRTVNEPFDPLKMRTGKYSIDRLWKVYERSVIPSCSLPEEFIKTKFDQLFRKKQSYQDAFKNEWKKVLEEEKVESGTELPKHILNFGKHGQEEYVEITQEHLENLRHFLDTYPSPRRKLEMAVQDLRSSELQKISQRAAQPQKSSFEAGKDFRETTKKDLRDMLVKASEQAHAGRKPTEEVLNIRDLQKNKGRPTSKF